MASEGGSAARRSKSVRSRGGRCRRCSCDLRPPGADESGKPDDLAPPKLERDVGEDASPRKPLSPEDGVADLGLLLRKEVVQRPTDHQRHDLRLRQLGRRLRRDVTSVAKHRHGVRDRGDLFEPVADEDDRHPALTQSANGREEAVDFMRRERRGRLVLMRTRALDESALAISRSWRSARPSPRTGVSDRVSPPKSSRMRDLRRAWPPSRPCGAGCGCAGRRRRSPPRSSPGRRSAPDTWRRCRADAPSAGRRCVSSPPRRLSRPRPAE